MSQFKSAIELDQNFFNFLIEFWVEFKSKFWTKNAISQILPATCSHILNICCGSRASLNLQTQLPTFKAVWLMLPDNSMPVEVVISLPEVAPAVKPHLPMAQSSTEIPACMAAGHSTLLCDDISYLVRDQLPLNQCYYFYVVLWSNVFFQMQCPVFWYCISCCTSTFGQFFFPQTRKKPPHAMWFARGGGALHMAPMKFCFLFLVEHFFDFAKAHWMWPIDENAKPHLALPEFSLTTLNVHAPIHKRIEGGTRESTMEGLFIPFRLLFPLLKIYPVAHGQANFAHSRWILCPTVHEKCESFHIHFVQF